MCDAVVVGKETREDLFFKVEEVVGVPAESLLAGGVLHDGVGAVGGHRSDAVLRVREVRANLELKSKNIFLWFRIGKPEVLSAQCNHIQPHLNNLNQIL